MASEPATAGQQAARRPRATSRAARRGLALLSAAAALACATPALLGAADASARLSTAQRRQIDSLVEATRAAGRYPGLDIGVYSPRGGTFERAYGARRLTVSRALPLRTGDGFRVGSITKTMTATVVLRLVQEGRLSLSTPLSAFYPGVLHAHEITIRALLDHTSLIPDLDRATPESLLRAPRQRFDTAEVIGAALTQPFFAPPWGYSDTNYLLLGQIVARVTDHSLGFELRRDVFKPLGLAHTSFDPGTVVPAPAAHGYALIGGRRADVTRWTTSYSAAAGSVVSTLGDLRRWATALVRGTLLNGRLQRERLRWVQTGHVGFEYGLGIFKIAGFIGHNGLLPGYDCTMLYSPSLRTTVVVLGNGDPELDEPAPQPTPSTLQLAVALGRIAGASG
jgi:D-alanyl-D-alanine carboxypeptidase